VDRMIFCFLTFFCGRKFFLLTSSYGFFLSAEARARSQSGVIIGDCSNGTKSGSIGAFHGLFFSFPFFGMVIQR